MLAEPTNPDALLHRIARERKRKDRGKLKVFFGMAPGAGKTFAMLEEARDWAADGLDVVIGYAEPHIRSETEALLLGLEILPYKTFEHGATQLKEFDLDAAITRRPTLILVDELAHSNAPGMRHPKRWQDVAELLEAGIHVYTTLNVQHLESAVDIVERITGERIRETLPDSVLEQADQVELIDIAPEELMERLREGKVHRADIAEHAMRSFFTKGNLLALRELALRTTAQRVDAQMRDFRSQNRVETPWAASERALVCVGPSPMSRRLVRATRRLAVGLRAEWVAVYVETPGAQDLTSADRGRLEGTLQLAEQLGARTVTLSGQNVAEEIVAYARTHNITRIIIGKPQRPRWKDLLFGSVVSDLIRRSGEIDVQIIQGRSSDRETEPVTERSTSRFDWRGYITALCAVAATTLVGELLARSFHTANEIILMLYLIAVLAVSARHSRASALLTSILSVAAFDFCFVPPYYTLAVAESRYLVVFAAMLLTSLLISTFTARIRAQAHAARERERRTAALFALSRDLAASEAMEAIVSAAVRHVSDVLNCAVAVLLPNSEGQLSIQGAQTLSPEQQQAAQWAFQYEQSAGRDTTNMPEVISTCMPLRAGSGTVGVMLITPRVNPRGSADHIGAEQRQLLDAFASQIALAVERARLAEDARKAWERVEEEFLRNTLLSAVSHDLRTPLAGIIGAATAMLEGNASLSPEQNSEMLDVVIEEAQGMERLINNLLDMTRLEAGGIAMNRDWQDIGEIIAASLTRLDRQLTGRKVAVAAAPDLPLVQIDAVAIEQVLTNLLENAIQYTPPDSPLEISASVFQTNLVVDVSDHGPGLPAGMESKVFEKFFRATPAKGRRGIGLGLAICKGIVEAHGGTITAFNRSEGGACFRFILPIPAERPIIDTTG